MSDAEQDIQRLNSIHDRTNVKTPHCIVCGQELYSSDFFFAGVTLYACQNDTCKAHNNFVQRYDTKPRGHAVGDEPIFKDMP